MSKARVLFICRTDTDNRNKTFIHLKFVRNHKEGRLENKGNQNTSLTLFYTYVHKNYIGVFGPNFLCFELCTVICSFILRSHKDIKINDI